MRLTAITASITNSAIASAVSTLCGRRRWATRAAFVAPCGAQMPTAGSAPTEWSRTRGTRPRSSAQGRLRGSGPCRVSAPMPLATRGDCSPPIGPFMAATVGTRRAETRLPPSRASRWDTDRRETGIALCRDAPRALVPLGVASRSFRPQYTGSPFRKPDATVNVDVSAARAAGVSTQTVTAARRSGLQKLSSSRLKDGLRAAGAPEADRATGPAGRRALPRQRARSSPRRATTATSTSDLREPVGGNPVPTGAAERTCDGSGHAVVTRPGRRWSARTRTERDPA